MSFDAPPEIFAEAVGLTYVHDHDPGITRRRSGKGFAYRGPDGAPVQDRATLKRIRALGAGLAIDDFGTGQSSLSQLKDLPFGTVKIDKSFLSRHGGTHSESDSDVVLNSVVSLAHDLKRDVVVEGVETEAEAERVKEIGCEYAQGFYYSPPLQLADALNYIARHYNPGTADRVADSSGPSDIGGKPGGVGAKRS